MERCGQRYNPITLPQWKRPGTHSIGGRVGPTTGAEDLAVTWIRYPDTSARSESLYRQCYPSHICPLYNWKTFPHVVNLYIISHHTQVFYRPITSEYWNTEISQTSKLEFMRETVLALNLFVYFTYVLTLHDFQQMVHVLQLRFSKFNQIFE